LPAALARRDPADRAGGLGRAVLHHRARADRDRSGPGQREAAGGTDRGDAAAATARAVRARALRVLSVLCASLLFYLYADRVVPTSRRGTTSPAASRSPRSPVTLRTVLPAAFK